MLFRSLFIFVLLLLEFVVFEKDFLKPNSPPILGVFSIKISFYFLK